MDSVVAELKKDHLSNDRLNQLAKEVSDLSDNDFARLSMSDLQELQKLHNPYLRNIQLEDRHYLNFSLTQINETWMRRFLMTGLIGFLFRQCEEWDVPKGIPVVPVAEYIKNPDLLKTPEDAIKAGDAKVLYDYEYNRKMMQRRINVMAFLETVFQFNPDQHVRSSYTPDDNVKSRKPIASMAAECAINHLREIDPKFKIHDDLKNLEGKLPTKKEKRFKMVNRVYKKNGVIVRTEPVRTEYEVDVPDFEAILALKKKNAEGPNPTAVAGEHYEMIPPLDTFYHFDQYLTEYYDKLTEATNHLYPERKELNCAINVFGVYDDLKKAIDERNRATNQFISSVYTLKTGEWTIIEATAPNRANVQYNNEKTAVLEGIMMQHEIDAQMASNIVKKTVAKEKKKNIIENGPDDPSFKAWKESNSEIKKTDLSNFTGVAEDTPDGCVRVDVWNFAETDATKVKQKMLILAEDEGFVQNIQAEAGLLKPKTDASATSAPAQS